MKRFVITIYAFASMSILFTANWSLAANLLLSEGYESGANNWYLGTGLGVCTTRARHGSYSLCADYRSGVYIGEESTTSWTNRDGYMSFWQWLPSGWTLSDTNGQGHWFRFQGWCWQFDTVWAYTGNGAPKVEHRLYDTGGSGCTGSAYNRYFLPSKVLFDGTWHRIELQWHHNSAGASDGWIKSWLDGQLWGNFQNIQMIPNTGGDTSFVNYRIQFPSNTGGSTSGSIGNYDSLEVWDGCPTSNYFPTAPSCGSGGDSIPPAPPSNLSVGQLK